MADPSSSSRNKSTERRAAQPGGHASSAPRGPGLTIETHEADNWSDAELAAALAVDTAHDAGGAVTSARRGARDGRDGAVSDAAAAGDGHGRTIVTMSGVSSADCGATGGAAGGVAGGDGGAARAAAAAGVGDAPSPAQPWVPNLEERPEAVIPRGAFDKQFSLVHRRDGMIGSDLRTSVVRHAATGTKFLCHSFKASVTLYDEAARAAVRAAQHQWDLAQHISGGCILRPAGVFNRGSLLWSILVEYPEDCTSRSDCDPLDEDAAKLVALRLFSIVADAHDFGCFHERLAVDDVWFDVGSGRVAVDGWMRTIVAESGVLNAEGMVECGGLPAWLSPEIAVGDDPGVGEQRARYGWRVDSWALGMLTFQLMHRGLPLVDKSLMQLIMAISRREFTWPSDWTWREARRFISELLTCASERPSVRQMLRHPWLQSTAQRVLLAQWARSRMQLRTSHKVASGGALLVVWASAPRAMLAEVFQQLYLAEGRGGMTDERDTK